MESDINTTSSIQHVNTPKNSVVRIYFSQKHISCSYFNDRFDLKCGDIVYVEGKLEGVRGYVEEVNYNFKINPSDYKKVIAQASTRVCGKFFIADSRYVTFDKEALPYESVLLWFKAPLSEGEEYVYGYDDTVVNIEEFYDDAGYAPTPPDNYPEIKYICFDGVKCRAIVGDSHFFEVEFEYSDDKIKHLICTGYCEKYCRHKKAAIIALKAILKWVSSNYSSEYLKSNYFAAMDRYTFVDNVFQNKSLGEFTLESL